MPSDRKKKQAQAKGKGPAKPADKADDQVEGSDLSGEASSLAAAMQELNTHARSCTGVRTSHPQSRDVHFDSFTLLYHGHELLMDTRLELNFGR